MLVKLLVGVMFLVVAVVLWGGMAVSAMDAEGRTRSLAGWLLGAAVTCLAVAIGIFVSVATGWDALISAVGAVGIAATLAAVEFVRTSFTWAEIRLWLRGCRKSLVIWFNAVGATAIAAMPYLADNFVQLQPYMTEETYKALAGVFVAGNLILRFKTKQALNEK